MQNFIAVTSTQREWGKNGIFIELRITMQKKLVKWAPDLYALHVKSTRVLGLHIDNLLDWLWQSS